MIEEGEIRKMLCWSNRKNTAFLNIEWQTPGVTPLGKLLSRNVGLGDTQIEEVVWCKGWQRARAQCLSSLGPIPSQPVALGGSKEASERKTSSSVMDK